ncbi:MAG TPA: ABC transporter substrate-binding protein [Candidatus Udaeobacter sp.]|jgi:iron(III) transport system substrate-binding protein|nr:ABC transporter substrate-binding protein [Candidatus Udaeobacter sp.]
MKVSGLIVLALLLLPSEAWVQARKPASIAELASYRGADRERLLYAGAKTEAKIVWYTSLAGGSYKEIIKAFETKYLGIKVESFRASGNDLVVRLEEEAKAKRNIADTIETTEGSLMFLRDGGLLRPYDSPHLDKYPEEGKERADKGHVFWALARESYIGFTYNKQLVPREGVPRNFEGLLNPQLKGKLGISIGQTSAKVIGAIIKTKGEEFLRKVKAQDIKLYSIDAPALVDVIAAGEIVASPAIFQTHTLLAASKGAPLEWVPMELVPTNVGSAAIAANPPHPHAALLMADFLLSPDGQGILEKFYYGSATKDQGFKKWRPERGLTTEKYEKELVRWEKFLREITRK